MTGKKIEISLDDNKVYIVNNGNVIPVDLPETGHGEIILQFRDENLIRHQTTFSKLIK